MQLTVLRQFEMVRIRDLHRPLDEYDGWQLNQRPPRIGDIGIIVDILRSPGYPDDYVVECSDPEGLTIWLGDFRAEELETSE